MSDSKVAEAIGLNRSAVVKWKKGATPAGPTIQKLADYFGVTTDRLLTSDQKETAPVLTEKDRRDVARDVERIMGDLEHSGDLMFDGMPMSPEAKESMATAMRMGLEMARLKNKETYTPKKYRKTKE